MDLELSDFFHCECLSKIQKLIGRDLKWAERLAFNQVFNENINLARGGTQIDDMDFPFIVYHDFLNQTIGLDVLDYIYHTKNTGDNQEEIRRYREGLALRFEDRELL